MECLLCYESVEYKATFSCNHDICYRCATKMLFLYNNDRCPFCKIKRGKPIFCTVSPSTTKKETPAVAFSDLRADSEDDRALYASKQAKDAVRQLLVSRCKVCNSVHKSKDDLAQHFKKEHSRLLCTVCLENNHQFWDELVPYEFSKLSAHRKGTLKEPGFRGHSFCLHCNRYFFDVDSLKRHCQNAHQLCTVCEALGLRLQFYNTYADLETHYKAKHYCCTDSLCLKNRCYVFVNKSELWEHYLSQHSMNIQLSDIQVRNGNNPPVVALAAREEAPVQSLYRQTGSIVTPLINTPYFPSFSRATTAGSSSAEGITPHSEDSSTVPQCMNRRIFHQQTAASAARRKQIGMITKLFCDEINTGIGQFISGEKTLELLVKEIEEAVGNQVCLRILETVSFMQRQKEVNEFSKGYKKSVLFPSFKKTEPRNERRTTATSGATSNIGFKIVDSSQRQRKKY